MARWHAAQRPRTSVEWGAPKVEEGRAREGEVEEEGDEMRCGRRAMGCGGW